MKKLYFIVLLMFFLLIYGCSEESTGSESNHQNVSPTVTYTEVETSPTGINNIVSISEIESDVKNLDFYYSSNYTTDSLYECSDCTIIKRQTNINEKTDIVYVEAVEENDYFNVTAEFVLYYNYYDYGGWILDNTSYQIVDAKAIAPPNLSDYLSEATNTYQDYTNFIFGTYCDSLEFVRFDYVSTSDIEFDVESQTAQLKLNIKYCDVSSVFGHYDFIFDVNSGWTRKLNDKELEKIGKTISINTNPNEYDIKNVMIIDDYSFNYLHTEGEYDGFAIIDLDAENRTAEIKDYYFGYFDKEYHYNLEEDEFDPFFAIIGHTTWSIHYTYNGNKWISCSNY